MDKIFWSNILRKVSNIYNFYSQNDLILALLYKGAELGNNPIGIDKIVVLQNNNLKYGNLYNYDVSYKIDSHSSYIPNLNSIYYLIYKNS